VSSSSLKRIKADQSGTSENRGIRGAAQAVNAALETKTDPREFSPFDVSGGLLDVLDWQPGDRLFNQYDVVAVHTGGMARVYICEVGRQRDRIVLKIPKLPLEDVWNSPDVSLEGVKGELAAWRRLGAHRNVVQLIRAERFTFFHVVRPADEALQAWYIPALLIEYGGSGTLANVIQKLGEYASKQVVGLLVQVALGMQHAATCGVCPHLDLKPSNVLVDRDSVARVTDFGLARLAAHTGAANATPRRADATRSFMTDRGPACGTPAYMAPEQWLGSTVCDVRTDVYAFGLLAFEMLTGRHAFAEALHWGGLERLGGAHLHDSPPLELLGQWPQLRPVVERCLQKDARGRSADWDDVLGALPADVVQREQHLARSSPQSAETLLRTALYLRDGDELTRLLARTPGTRGRSAAYVHAEVFLLLQAKRYARAFLRAGGALLCGRLHWRDLDPGLRWDLMQCLKSGVAGGYGIAFLVGLIWATMVTLSGRMAAKDAFGVVIGCAMLAMLAFALFTDQFNERLRAYCPNCRPRVRLRERPGRRCSIGRTSFTWSRICPRCGYHSPTSREDVGGWPRWLYRVDTYRFLGCHCGHERLRWRPALPPEIVFGKPPWLRSKRHGRRASLGTDARCTAVAARLTCSRTDACAKS